MNTQKRIAEFLEKHGRFVFTERQMNLTILGTTPSPDGGTDYAVRTLVNANGKNEIFNSHVRIYASEHMRLIR